MQGQQAYGMQQQMGVPPVYSNQPQQAPPGKLLYIIDIPGMIYVLWIYLTPLSYNIW